MEGSCDKTIEELNAFNFARQTRPLAAIARLHERLIPFSEPFRLSARRSFYFGENEANADILLLQTGFFSVCRVTDDLHMASGFAPTVVGLIDGYSTIYEIKYRPKHYLIAESECCGYRLPVTLFAEKMDEFNLWHDVARILAQRLMVMSARENELVGVDVFTRVRALLLELWIYPQDVRNQINVQTFIQIRTSVSRSQILKILAALKAGGYITIERGRLTNVQKIPRSF